MLLVLLAMPNPSHYITTRPPVTPKAPKSTRSPPPNPSKRQRDENISQPSRASTYLTVAPAVTTTSAATAAYRPHHRPRSTRPIADLATEQERPRGELDAEDSLEPPGMTARSSEDFEMGDMDDLDDGRLEDDEETGLTGQDKRRRRERKAAKTRLDERVAGGAGGAGGAGSWNNGPGPEGHNELIKSALFWRNIGINGTLIGLW